MRVWPFKRKGSAPAEGGTEAAHSVCLECGKPMPMEAQTCPSCGAKVEAKEERGKAVNWKRSVLFLLRDIALALLIVAIILAAIYAYTRNWPPMVVVESASMQHGDEASAIGVIDTGDLVLVQLAPQRSDVTTWVEGKATGYRTYGDFGDVIVFRKPGQETPVIHRPMFWMDYDEARGGFNIPDLARLPRSLLWGGVYKNGSVVSSPYGLDSTLWIAESGYNGDVNLTYNINGFLGIRTSGYVTMGDNNLYRNVILGRATHGYDSNHIVKQGDIIGKARGELPWFGLIKLTLFPGQSGCCQRWGDSSAPRNSWDSLAISLVLLIATPIILDVSTTLWYRWKKKRKHEEEEARAGDVRPEAPSADVGPSQTDSGAGGAVSEGEGDTRTEPEQPSAMPTEPGEDKAQVEEKRSEESSDDSV